MLRGENTEKVKRMDGDRNKRKRSVGGVEEAGVEYIKFTRGLVGGGWKDTGRRGETKMGCDGRQTR